MLSDLCSNTTSQPVGLEASVVTGLKPNGANVRDMRSTCQKRVSVGVAAPVDTVGSGYSPVSIDERRAAGVTVENAQGQLPWPRIRLRSGASHNAGSGRSLSTGIWGDGREYRNVSQ